MSNAYSIPLLDTAPSGPRPLPDFLSEISAFTTALQTFLAGIEQIASLHNEALLSTESTTSYSAGASAQLESTVANASAQARTLKDRIKALERDMLLSERDGLPEARTKRGQVEKAKSNLQEALREFEKTERMYSRRYAEQQARQYRIVNPNATEEEIREAVESGQTQVFSQALLSSGRSASASSVARAVRERQQDIARIEKTLEELALLFQQMEEQVLLADPIIDNIDDVSHVVVGDLEQSRGQLGQAVVSIESRNRNRRRCLWISLAILLVIIIIIVIVVLVRQRATAAPAPAPAAPA